ncbi:hypothetical protein V8C86DRAFT_16358 [Haematococcus lacustris]
MAAIKTSVRAGLLVALVVAVALVPNRVEGRSLLQNDNRWNTLASILQARAAATPAPNSRLAAILSAPPSFVVGAAPGPDLTSGLAGTTAGGLAGGTGIGAGSGGPGNAGVGSAGASVGK